MLLFEWAARSAARRLVAMTSRLDESSDRERIPSEFFLRLAAAARGRAVGLRDLAEGHIPGLRSVSLDNPAPDKDQLAVDEGEIRLRLLTADPGSARAALIALEGEEPDLLSGPVAYDEARRRPRLTGYDGKLADPLLVREVAAIIGPAAGPVSPSRLEDYARCPYFFFLKRVMGLEGWEEEESPDRIDPLDRGQMVHAILEKFLTQHPGAAMVSTPLQELRQSLALLARQALESARPAAMPDLLWEIERDGLEQMLRNWLDFEIDRIAGGLLPAQLERAFGKFAHTDASLSLRMEAGRHIFTFRGRIDRVDLSPDSLRARVIDYKTGVLPKSMSRQKRPLLMGGEKIQIAIYRMALAVLDDFRQVESVEGEYLHLQPNDGQVVPCSFTDETLEAACERLPAILEIVGDGLENGVFFARSSGTVRSEGHCKYCDFLPVCGKDRIQREERKSGDPEVLRFLKILDIDALAEET
jgi:ATP-dependent helicase/nuclease subunit B